MQEEKIRRALVSLLYRNAYGVMISNVATSSAAFYILQRAVPLNFLLIWLGTIFALTFLRGVIAVRFLSRNRESESIAKWEWLAAAFSWASGLLWGALGWMGFMPDEPLVFSFTMVVLTGLVCGTVPALSAFPPALIGSVLATTIPLAIRSMMFGGEISGPFLFLVITLVAINFYYCHSTYRMLRETIALRLENENLAENLAKERDRMHSANQSKTRFLAAASHDLRQPIHALSLLVTTLSMLGKRGHVSSGEALNLADRAKSLVGNLSGLLDALLDISKLDAGVVAPDREPVSLQKLFQDFQSEFAMHAQERNLDWRVIDRDILVDSDPMMLKRILSNLLSNAFRYTESGGILLGCRKRGEFVEIQVWDTGIGIPHSKQNLIFEEFVQLHNPERDRSQGLGLGLAIVQRTAELLGHSVRVVSEAGKGSLFSVTVPAILKPLGQNDAKLIPLAASPSLGIIVVDDESEVLNEITHLLTIAGHRVYAGISVEDAISAHQVSRSETTAGVDLIIADYRLRGQMTGIMAIADLTHYLEQEVPAIIVTGDTSPARLKEVAASGIHIVHKPVDGELLLKEIDLIVQVQTSPTRSVL